MRILWYTDTHFGRNGAFSFPSPSGYTTRIDETLRLHRWIKDLIVEKDPDLVINGGDIFKPQVTIHASEVSSSIKGTAMIIKNSKQHITLLGNHDYLSRDTKVTAVDWVEEFDNSSLVKTVDSFEVDDNTLIILIPYVWDYSYVEKKVAEMAKGYEKVFVFGHAEIIGAVDSVVMDMGSGEKSEHLSSSKNSLSPTFLSQFTMAFNGHHHIPQKLKENVVLTGSIQQFTVTEAEQEIPRGVYIIDTETNNVSFYENNVSPKIFRVENNIDVLKELPKNNYVVYYANVDNTDFDALMPELKKFRAYQLKKINPKKFRPLTKVEFKSRDEDYVGIYKEYLETLSFQDQNMGKEIEKRGERLIKSLQKEK